MASKLLESLQTDLPTRSYRVTNGFNESLYLAANEPSLGLYRIQEHVQNSVPRVVEQRQALQEICGRVDGASYDLEYDSVALKELSSVKQFSSLPTKIERAIYLKKQLDELDRQRKSKSTSMAKDYGTMTTDSHITHTPSINSDTTDLKPKVFD